MVTELQQAIVLDTLKIVDEIICRTSRRLAQLAIWVYSGNAALEKITEAYKVKITNPDQWASRLSEYCASQNDIDTYWKLIGEGLEPFHAFAILMDALRIEDLLC